MHSFEDVSCDRRVIFDLLSWRSNSTTSAYLKSLKSENGNFVLKKLARRVQRMQHGGTVAEGIQSLPSKQFARIIRAPAFRSALVSDDDAEFAGKVSSWVAAELLAIDQTEFSKPVETALGDISISKHKTKRALISHTLVVDSLRNSDAYKIRHSGSDAEIDTYQKLSPDELRDYVSKCDIALSDIQATNVPCYLFVVELVRTLFPVADAQNGAFRGSSDMNALGRVVHYNPANKNVSSFELAVSIVHEAVHTFLYMHEEQRPFFFDTDRAHTIFVRSPWTGRNLHLRGFAHACFVWFAIYHLLRTSFVHCERHMVRAANKIDNICTGFLSQQFVSSLQALKNETQNDIFEILVEMSLLMVEQCRAHETV